MEREEWVSGAARDAAWLTGGSLSQAAVSFASNLVLVRFLAPAEFGRFAIVLGVVSLAAVFVNFRLDELLLREPMDGLTERRLGLYWTGLALESLVVLALGILALALAGLLTLPAMALLIGTVGTRWMAVQERFCERGFRYRSFSLIQTGAHGAAHLFAVLGVVVGFGALVLYVRDLVRLAAQGLGFAGIGTLRPVRLRRLTAKEVRALAGRARGFWGDGVLQHGFERVVILTVGGLAGVRTTGFFFQARRLAVTPHQLLEPVASRMAFNYLRHRVPPERRFRTLLLGLSALAAGLGAVATGLWFAAGELVPWLFGTGWEPVVPLLLAMSGVVVALTPFSLVQAYFMAEGEMTPLLVWGRGGQYLAFGSAAGLVAVGPVTAGAGLALGLSAAYVAGALSPVLFLGYRRTCRAFSASASPAMAGGSRGPLPETRVGGCVE